MKKSSLMGERIKKLRSALGETQAKFGERFGVGQTAVSSWEIGDSPPSMEILLQLGNLASYPDNALFWRWAGLDDRAMVPFAREILKNADAPPAEGEVIRAPRIGKLLAEAQEEVSTMFVDTKYVPPDASPAYCLVDGRTGFGPIKSGDVVVLDVSGKEKAPQGFWDRVVLVTFHLPQQQRPHYPSPGISNLEERFYMGRLRCKNRGGLVWCAVVDPLEPPPRSTMDWRPGDAGLIIGQWPVPGWDLSAWEEHSSQLEGLNHKERDELARAELELDAAYHILGRVLYWRRP